MSGDETRERVRKPNKTEISVALEYADESVAARVVRAVQPDNEDVPEDTSIDMSICGGSLMIRVFSTGGLPSLLRTMDDLLCCIQVAERAARLD